MCLAVPHKDGSSETCIYVSIVSESGVMDLVYYSLSHFNGSSTVVNLEFLQSCNVRALEGDHIHINIADCKIMDFDVIRSSDVEQIRRCDC